MMLRMRNAELVFGQKSKDLTNFMTCMPQNNSLYQDPHYDICLAGILEKRLYLDIENE